MKLKLCGLTRPQDIHAANRCMPDYVGFVFAPSRRRVLPERAAELVQGLDSGIKKVGVFVDEQVPVIMGTARAVGLDVIQLHGREEEAVVLELQSALPEAEVWRAIRLKDAGSLKRAEESSAHMLLIDAFSKEAAGGTGKVADWPLLLKNRPRRPFFLAGGLGGENIPQAMELIRPYGLDISSGIETEGHKDPEKMQAITRLVRDYQGGKHHE